MIITQGRPEVPGPGSSEELQRSDEGETRHGGPMQVRVLLPSLEEGILWEALATLPRTTEDSRQKGSHL